MAFDSGAGRQPNKVKKNPPGPAQESSLGRAGRRLGRGIGRIFDGAYDSAAALSAEVVRLIGDLWNSLRRLVNRALGRSSSGSGEDYSALPGDDGPGPSPEQAAHAYGEEGQPYPQARDRSRVVASEVSQQRPSPKELALLTIAQESARGQPAHAERTGGPGWTNPTLEHEAFENEIMRLVMSDERWKEAYEKYPERIPPSRGTPPTRRCGSCWKGNPAPGRSHGSSSRSGRTCRGRPRRSTVMPSKSAARSRRSRT